MKKRTSTSQGMIVRLIVLFISFFLFCNSGLIAQETSPKKEKRTLKQMIRDSSDNKLDLSVWLSEYSGFIPVISIITEPALDYGLVGSAVFFHRKKKIGITDDRGIVSPPSITSIGGAYTGNKSWMAYALHRGIWRNDRIRYIGFLGYVSLNMDYYSIGNIELNNPIQFNIEGLPLIQRLTFRLGKSDFLIGGQYTFFNSVAKVNSRLDDRPIIDSLLNTLSYDFQLSSIGLVATWERRDNSFTPNKGFLLETKWNTYANWLGSDFEYNLFETTFLLYTNKIPQNVIGTKLYSANTSGDVIMYFRPDIDMRGIQMNRYQGEQVFQLEVEDRFNINYRWAVVGFVGSGWTANVDEGNWDWSKARIAGGAGFRYNLARKFNLYMGLDVARGPEIWAVYTVFGTDW